MPTEADHGDVHRMVSDVEVIPGLASIYIQPLNRGGRWTIDEHGTYAPFDGVFPTRKFLAHRNWVQRADGGVIGANPTDLFVLDPTAAAFRHLLSARDAGVRQFGKLSYDAHSDTVFVETYTADGPDLHELHGDRLVRSRFAREDGGRGPIYPPRYVAMLDAYLITTRRGYVYLRRSDGTWRFVHEQFFSDHQDRARMRQVHELPEQRLIVVLAAHELFVIDVADPTDPQLHFAVLGRQRLDRAIHRSSETGAVLVYDQRLYFARDFAVSSHWQWYLRGLYIWLRRIFLGLSAAPETPAADESWLLEITRDGMAPVPGDVVVPARSRASYRTVLTDLPGWGLVLVFTEDGLALYDGRTVRHVPDAGPERVGRYPRAVLLPTLDRVLIASEKGLFELTRERTLASLDTPFRQTIPLRPGIVIEPHIFDAPTLGGAVALSADGVFFLDGDGMFHPVRGGEAVGFGAGVEVVATLPGSGDLLVKGEEALFLLRRAGCH